MFLKIYFFKKNFKVIQISKSIDFQLFYFYEFKLIFFKYKGIKII